MINKENIEQNNYYIKQKIEVVKKGKLKGRHGKIVDIATEGDIQYYGVVLDDGHNTGRLFRKEYIKPI